MSSYRILGIFSASNRQLAKEALDCVFRRVTLRPCNTGFDEKMKAKILGTVITRSETVGPPVEQEFRAALVDFLCVAVASSIWSLHSVYLFYATGSCNGLNQSGFCVFDPKGNNNQVSTIGQGCKVIQLNGGGSDLERCGLDGFPVLNPTATG